MRRFTSSVSHRGAFFGTASSLGRRPIHQMVVESTTTTQLHNVAKYQFLRSNLRLVPLEQITKERFLSECKAVGLSSEQEASECLSRFANAGIVIVAEDFVFLRPAKVLEECQTSMGIEKHTHDVAAHLRSELATLQQELVGLQTQKDTLDAKAGATRKLWWAAATLYASCQMYVMSRFTFVDFDWDVMEPVSFFLTTGTALVFFVWYLVRKQEHTYTKFDLVFLPGRLRKVYNKAGFDYTRWVTIHTRMEEINLELKKTEEWKTLNG